MEPAPQGKEAKEKKERDDVFKTILEHKFQDLREGQRGYGLDFPFDLDFAINGNSDGRFFKSDAAVVVLALAVQNAPIDVIKTFPTPIDAFPPRANTLIEEFFSKLSVSHLLSLPLVPSRKKKPQTEAQKAEAKEAKEKKEKKEKNKIMKKEEEG